MAETSTLPTLDGFPVRGPPVWAGGPARLTGVGSLSKGDTASSVGGPLVTAGGASGATAGAGSLARADSMEVSRGVIGVRVIPSSGEAEVHWLGVLRGGSMTASVVFLHRYLVGLGGLDGLQQGGWAALPDKGAD